MDLKLASQANSGIKLLVSVGVYMLFDFMMVTLVVVCLPHMLWPLVVKKNICIIEIILKLLLLFSHSVMSNSL